MTHLVGKMDSRSQIKSSAILAYITIVFYVIAGLLYTPYLVKTIGMSDYGLFTLCTSVIAYFTVDFGIGAAITRYIAKYRAEENEQQVKNLLGITLKLYLLIDFLIFIALLVIFFFANDIFSNLTLYELDRFKNIFAITSFFILISFLFLPINGIFIAYERMFAMKLLDLILKILSVITLVLVLYLGLGLYGIVLTTCLVTLTVQIIKFTYLYKVVNLRINIRYKNKALLKSIGSFSAWTSIAMIGDKFFFTIIPFLLAIFSNTKEIAIFAVVASIEGYILTFANSLNGLFLPRVIKMVVDNKDTSEITDLMIKVGRIQLLIIGLMIIGVFAFGKEFIFHWLGNDFDKSYYALVLVLIPCLIHMTEGIANELIYAKNKIQYRAMVYILGSIISVLSIVFLSPSLGALGAAIGIFLGFLIAHEIVMNIIYQKVLKLNIIRFFKECHLKMIIPMIIAGIIGFVIQYYFVTLSLISFMGKVLLWVLIYISIMWFFALNKYEKEMFSKPILRILMIIKYKI